MVGGQPEKGRARAGGGRAAPKGFLLGRRCPEQAERRVGFVCRTEALTGGGGAPGEVVAYGGDAPVITMAPTGAGKTSGPVVSNLLLFPGQVIAVDVKGELLALTGRRRRAMGQEVHVLDLRDGASGGGCLNPLDLAARSGTEAAAVGRSFAACLIERGEERDRFWNDWAETLIGGAAAWLLEDCPPGERSLSRVFDLFTDDDPVYKIATMLDAKRVRNRAAYAAFAGFLSLPDRETRPCVLGSTTTHLRIFDSALVRRLTDATSFDLDALVAGRPMTIYIVVPPSRLAAYAPLLRIWLSGLMNLLSLRQRAPRRRTLMLVDEAAQLGRMQAFVLASTLMRSYGLTLWSVWQNAAQLDMYGAQARTLVDNAGAIQFFGVRNMRMAEELAALVGGVDPRDLMSLGRDEQYVLLEGGLPQRIGQVRYYDDPLFEGLPGGPRRRA
ncbi:type IV secretion system protein VirD4, partial [Belnapia rosea]